MERSGGTVGPDVIVPGSQQLIPGLLLLLLLMTAAVTVVLVLRRLVRARRGRPNGRPVVVVPFAAVVVVAAVGAWMLRPPPFFVPRFGALPTLMPEDNLFRRTASDLPVSADSGRWIAAIDEIPLRAGFSGQVIDRVVFGIPYNFVDDSTPRADVDIKLSPRTSFAGPYPITDPAYIESMPTYGFDMHYVGIDPARAQVWELLSTRSWFGRWEADSGAHYRTDSNEYPRGSTIAAGLPLLPGTITYDQVSSGSIEHVMLAGINTSAAGESIWPARRGDGRSPDPDAPPQGAWLRLKPDTDLSPLGPQARVVAAALQRYGLILSDTGPGFAVRGTPDSRWDNADLDTLRQLSGADFEVVDPTGIQISPDSLAVLPPA